jgi:hypothetical protein
VADVEQDAVLAQPLPAEIRITLVAASIDFLAKQRNTSFFIFMFTTGARHRRVAFLRKIHRSTKVLVALGRDNSKHSTKFYRGQLLSGVASGRDDAVADGS